MRRTALIAAAIGGLSVSASSFGAFTFSIGTPNRTLIPGRVVVQLYALNDGVGTGTNLSAFNPVLAATGGLFRIAIGNGPDGDPGTPDDEADFANANGPNGTLTTAGNGFSYIRVGGASATFVVSATPATTNLALYQNGIAAFQVTETTTAAVPATSTVNGGLGFRTAVLVLDSSATTFTLSGQIGGNVGAAQTIAPQTFNIGTGPTNPTPVVTFNPTSATVDVSPAGLEGFGPVTVTSTGTGPIVFSTLPAQIADNIVFGGTGTARTVTGAGFTYADLGTYTITATDGTGSSIFTLNVVPEPTSIAALGLAGLGLIRRRK